MAAIPAELLSLADFYAFMGLATSEVAFLKKYAIYRYNRVQVPKRRGGTRELLIPDKRLKYLQRKILPLLEQIYEPRYPVHGFVKNKSVITNANSHQSRPYILNLDLKDFFGTITRNRVEGLLRYLGVPLDVSEAIGAVCTAAYTLPQGAPTSPILANMVSFRLDNELTRFCKSHNFRYTRYADDLTISSYVEPHQLFEGSMPASGIVEQDKLSSELQSIILRNAFIINSDKTRYFGKKRRKEVTGLVVNEFTNVRRTFVRDLRAALFKVQTLGLAAAQADYDAKYGPGTDLQRMLRGRLEWLGQVRSRSFSAYRTLAFRYNDLFPLNQIPIDPTFDEILKEAVLVVQWDEGDTGDQDAQGTAFFLEGVGLVTAHHCLKDMPVEWAEIFHPHRPTIKYRAKLSPKFSEHHDLAILEHNIPAHVQHSLKRANGPTPNKSNIIAAGYPEFGPADSLSERTGQVIARTTRQLVKYIEVSAVIGDGLSGCPVINDRYEVIAIGHSGGALESKQLAVDVNELDNLP
ncbi:MAG: reverse transcriptase domain-containing protein [Asticcacaulis sp.]|uniref:reverse transcriptase domain-containing protein n=1 Tax=Asticcacaulis sp. TaxID=1872648 RepID=UPI0039E596F2